MVSPHNFYALTVDPYNLPGCKSTVDRAFPAESVPTWTVTACHSRQFPLLKSSWSMSALPAKGYQVRTT